MRFRKTLLAGTVVAALAAPGADVSANPLDQAPALLPLEIAPAAQAVTTVESPPSATAAGARSSRRAARILMRGINRVRALHGLRRLRSSPRLRRSATRYGRWMLRHDHFGHTSSAPASGEILARHSGRRPKPSKALRMWMNSPGHRSLVLSRRLGRAGAAAVAGRYGRAPSTFWVVHFGRR